MAMNETYNLTINGDGSKLNKELHTILDNLRAIEGQNMSKPLKDYESKIKKAVSLNKELQKVMSKNQGNDIVSSKDMNKSIKLTQEMTTHMKDLQGVLKDVQKTGLSNGIKADYDALHQTINGLSGTMNSTIKQQKQFNSLKTTRDPNVQALIKDWEKLGKMPKEYEKSKKNMSKVKEENKTVNKQRNRITSANEREKRDGKYSARDGAEVAKALNQDYGEYRKALKEGKKALKDLNKKQQDLAKEQEKNKNDYSSNKIDTEEYRKRTAKNTVMTDQYSKESKVLEEKVGNVNDILGDLGSNGATRKQFNEGRVARSRDTFLGTALERAPSIASHAVMGMGGAYGLQMAQGKSSLAGIRNQEIAMGQQTGASDYSALRKGLFEASDNAGLGFKPSELVNMSSEAMKAMGDKGLPNQQEITTELATGARGMGIADTDSYMQSMTDIMHSGAIDNDVDLKQFQKTVSGGIKESGMKAQADEQLKALSSMTNTMGANKELTTADLNSIASIQGTFAESGNKSLQGEKGAQAITKIQQGFSESSDNPGMRNVMGMGSEYTGMTGKWQYRKDMEDPENIGENLSKFMGFYGTATPEQEAATGESLVTNFDLSSQQAQEIMDMYNKGDLSEEELGKKVKEYQDGSEVDKNVKDQSEQQQGKDNRNEARQENQSQALYEFTGAIRNVQGAMAGWSPALYQGIIGIEALTAAMMSSAAMMGGAYGMKKGGGYLNRRGSSMTNDGAGKGTNRKGKGNRRGGTPGGKQRGKNNPKKPNGGNNSGGSGIIDNSMAMPMMMGGMMSGGMHGGGNQRGGRMGRMGSSISRIGMMGLPMMSMMGSQPSSGAEGEQQGGSSGMMGMMAQMIAMDALMNGGLGKATDLGKKGFGKGKDVFSKGKADYKKGGLSRVGKRGKHKFLRGDRALRDVPNKAKGGLGKLVQSDKVSKLEGGLGKGFDKTKDFAKKGYGKLSNFGGQSASGNMSKTLGKGSGMLGKLGKVGKFGKGIPLVGGALGALGIGSSLAEGDMKGASGGVGATAGATIGGTLGSIVPGLGTAIGATAGGLLGGSVGEHAYDTSKKNDKALKEGNVFGEGGLIDFNWSNGKEKGKDKGKGGFQDSVIGKPVTKAWNGITSLFGGGDSKGGGGGGGSAEPTLNQKAGTGGLAGMSNTEGNKDIKDSDNKKKKMTAEELRQKNNKSETENLKTFKNLLNRWEQSIQEAKGLDVDSDGGSSGDLGSAEGSDKKKSPDEWKDTIKKAAKAMGVDVSDSDINGIASLIKNESGGDPNITQDSNLKDGNAGANLAQGLLQYVPSTFDSYKAEGHGDIKDGYDQLLAFFNNKNWKKDYNPNGGWSPTGGKRKDGAGGGGRDWSLESQSTEEQPAYTNRSFATMQRQQMDSAQVPTNNTANVSVNITVNGSDSPERTAQSVRDNLNSYFNSEDLSIFQNNYRRT